MTSDKVMTAKQVQEWRLKFKMDQKAMGELLGVTWQAVRYWERGERDVPVTTAKTLRLLAKFPQLLKEF